MYQCSPTIMWPLMNKLYYLNLRQCFKTSGHCHVLLNLLNFQISLSELSKMFGYNLFKQKKWPLCL